MIEKIRICITQAFIKYSVRILGSVINNIIRFFIACARGKMPT